MEKATKTKTTIAAGQNTRLATDGGAFGKDSVVVISKDYKTIGGFAD